MTESKRWSRLGVMVAMAMFFAPLAAGAGEVALKNGKLEISRKLAGVAALDPSAFELAPELFSEAGGPGSLLEALLPRLEAQGGGFAYSFIHVSDIQVRDRSRPPWQGLLHAADPYVESSENNYIQDQADLFYLGYMLRVIRAATVGGHALFSIHTGDVAHLSRLNELDAFTQLIENFTLKSGPEADGGFGSSWLAAPINWQGRDASLFFNALGNHDVLYIGNVRSPLMRRNLVRHGVSAGQDLKTVYANYNRLYSQLGDLSFILGRPAGGAIAVNPVALEVGPLTVPAASAEARGYYSFDLAIPGHPQKKIARMIVLNTNDPADIDEIKGAYIGAIGPAQLEWLRGLLREANQRADVDHVLVFGHQRLKDIAVLKEGGAKVHPAGFVRDLLEADPKSVGYFRGHYHRGEILSWSGGEVDAEGLDPARLVEYGMPALMDYPKPIGQITVRSTGGGWEVSARYLNLEDLAAVGALPLKPLLEKGLIVAGDHPCRFMTPYLETGPRGLPSLLAHLEKQDLTGPERVLYLAFLCLNGALADADQLRDRGAAEQDQHDFAEWRDGPESDLVRFQRPRRVEK